MATEKFTGATSRGTILGTELNALADGGYTAGGTTINNQTNLDRFAIALLAVDFVGTPDAFSPVDLYMLPSPDGTNFVDGSASVIPATALLVATFELQASGSPQLVATSRFELLPAKLKFMVRNGSGEDFPATGSTITLYTFNREITG